ncbi:MAG: hypothetical protein HIU82_10135 [Proteobacteria bacterium]|nr:hypothetical protein [Pseudomonadota bacterium]
MADSGGMADVGVNATFMDRSDFQGLGCSLSGAMQQISRSKYLFPAASFNFRFADFDSY